MNTRGDGWRISVFVTGITVGVLLIIYYADPTSVVEAECNIQEGKVINTHAGASESFLSDLIGISGELWNYNPNPVWNDSVFWVMVDNDIAYPDPDARWAQIGWARKGTDTEPRVFLQAHDDQGALVTRWYHPDDTWKLTSSGAVVPPSAKQYELFKFGGAWYFSYDFGSYFTLPAEWLPNRASAAGETLNYEAVPGTDKGDHFPGDHSNKIQANNVKKNISGTWLDTSLARVQPTGNGDSDLANWSGDGVRVWDVRCTS